MNINDYPKELIQEEQDILNALISKLDRITDKLDKHTKDFLKVAKKAKESRNPDELVTILLAMKGMRDTAENRNRILQSRDELYRFRLLLQCDSSSGRELEEIKVGLHTCMDNAEIHVISWYRPLCRHFVLDNSSVNYEIIVKDEKTGDVYHSDYTLLVKNEIKLRFSKIIAATNLFPGIVSEELIEVLKQTNFFTDDYLNTIISRFGPDNYNPDEAAKIISDEFLQELLERRSSPEFKNIVFSIQKKQGEIIQAPYERNMVVQGCAGSGKSMIMFHRLPILLYDNPTSLSRSNLFVITPSQMYIQLAENMRHQLEISDIHMGTIEQYYDYCINKYSGHKPQEYGKINYSIKISSKNEKYLFSQQCIDDIKTHFDEILGSSSLSLDSAYSVLKLNKYDNRETTTYAQKFGNRLLALQQIIRTNRGILEKYFKEVRTALDSFNNLRVALNHRKGDILREISKQITKSTDIIEQAQKELESLDEEKNAKAIQSRNSTIETEKLRIDELANSKDSVETDNEYFTSLIQINNKLSSYIEPFAVLKNEFSLNTIPDLYTAFGNIGSLIGAYYVVSWELSQIDDKYVPLVQPIATDIEKIQKCISVLQALHEKYLELDYYQRILEENKKVSLQNNSAVKNAYEFILQKIGVVPSSNGNIRAIKYSPYLFLQILFQFKGRPTGCGMESLLAIDEAQGLALEEIRLLHNINDNRVIMNLYGDVNQHIEGTKGIDDWKEFRDVFNFDSYEIQENYRNASQITTYCNRIFDMKMVAINTPGKGVHEINTDEEFQMSMIEQLLNSQKSGLGAILVSNNAEAKYLLNRFSMYEDKFHDMTGEDFSIHRTRWNIMNIDDAKGLEFNSVIVLSGRMSRNQRYIAYTRALDDLLVYPVTIDLRYIQNEGSSKFSDNSSGSHQSSISKKDPQLTKTINNEVKLFFENFGLEVIDYRAEGGRLWVIGEKEKIRDVVNKALAKFNISGKYMSGKEIGNRNGWCTKTDK